MMFGYTGNYRRVKAPTTGVGSTRFAGCGWGVWTMRTISKAKSWIISDFFVYLYQAKVRVNFVSAFRPDAALLRAALYFAKMACISGGRRLGLPYRPVVL